MNAPAAISAASWSMAGRRAARTIGMVCSGGRINRKPPGPRSPASTSCRYSTVDLVLDRGRSNGIPFQCSTMTSDDVPSPSTNLPPLSSARAAAV